MSTAFKAFVGPESLLVSSVAVKLRRVLAYESLLRLLFDSCDYVMHLFIACFTAPLPSPRFRAATLPRNTDPSLLQLKPVMCIAMVRRPPAQPRE